MVTPNALKPTTTKQKFEDFARLLPDNSSKAGEFIFSDRATQSSRLNYKIIPQNYNKKLELIKSIAIDTLINFNYTLKKPIEVKIINNINGVTGDIEELELYSFGDNEFEVLRELNEELVDLFEYLIGIENKNLGKFPKKWKSILKKYIKTTK